MVEPTDPRNNLCEVGVLGSGSSSTVLQVYQVNFSAFSLFLENLDFFKCLFFTFYWRTVVLLEMLNSRAWKKEVIVYQSNWLVFSGFNWWRSINSAYQIVSKWCRKIEQLLLRTNKTGYIDGRIYVKQLSIINIVNWKNSWFLVWKYSKCRFNRNCPLSSSSII